MGLKHGLEVVFLASKASKWISGQVILVNGAFAFQLSVWNIIEGKRDKDVGKVI